MNTFIRKLVPICTLMVVGTICLKAQTRAYFVNYEYDNDGNRVSRFITIGNDRDERSSNDTTEVMHYTDLIDESQINIYPNPTTNSVFVNTTNPNDDHSITATLYSPSGVLLGTKSIRTTPVEFEISSMASGIYILELRSNTDTKIWKIIKR